MPSSAQMQRVDRAYLTITTVPSLDNCRDCLKVAASYEEEGKFKLNFNIQIQK